MSFTLDDQNQTQRIVHGFIYTVATLLSLDTSPFSIIPQPIINVILLYVHNLFSNQGMYTWQMNDSDTVHHMLHAKNGDKFESAPFKIARLQCKLEVYPNGDTKEMNGFFLIHLRLLSMPSNVKSIKFGRTFRILECKAAASWLSTVSTDIHDYWTRKAPLSELLELNPQTITIQVEVNIFKLMLKAAVNETLQKYPLNPVKTTYQLTQYLEYKLEKEDMDTFRSSTNCKSMCTKMLNDMWCIQLYPCGVNESGNGYLSCFLQLLSFPQNVAKMKIKYKIKCHQIDEEYEDTDDFDEDGFSSWGVDYFAASQVLYQFDTVTFSVEVQILETFSKETNSLEIWDQARISYMLSG
eukprot:38737_1